MADQQNYVAAKRIYMEVLPYIRDLGYKVILVQIFESMGYIALSEQDFVRGGRLLGTAENLSRTIGSISTPDWQIEHDRKVNSAFAVDYDGILTANWIIGQSYGIEQAISFALRDSDTVE